MINEDSISHSREKRNRKPQLKWETEFKWLIIDQQRNLLYCQPCRAIYGPLANRSRVSPNDIFAKRANGPFVTGSQNIKHCSLARHEESDGHKDAIARYDAKNAKKGVKYC